MLTLEDSLEIHDILIEKFGGAPGLRDTQALKAALARPFQTFDGKDLYPTEEEKAAALLESIVTNHPFIDGNKRTGYTLFRLHLLQHALDIQASQDEKYDLVIGVAKGQVGFNEILNWIRKRLIHAS